jgi:hypothetical protein
MIGGAQGASPTDVSSMMAPSSVAHLKACVRRGFS